MPRVAQRLAVTVAEQQRAQRLARPLAARVAADEKLGGAQRLHFQPGARAQPGLVGTVEALGDDPLVAARERGRIQLLGVRRGVHQLHMCAGQQALRQVAVTVAVGCGAQVEAGKVQQVETHEHHRRGALRGGDLRGALELRALLQRAERGAPASIERHDLAIEQQLPGRLCAELRGDLGKIRRQVEPAPRLQSHLARADEGEHPVAVELRLIAPRGVGARLAAGFREHRRERSRQSFGGSRWRELRRLAPGRRGGGRELLQAQAREHRGAAGQHIVRLREAVAVLDEQPLVRGARAHQRERALELLSAQQEAELAGGEPRAHALFGHGAIEKRVLRAFIGRIHAAIPHDDLAGTVLARGNDALEGGVIEGMILHRDRHALVVGIERRALGHRPGLQHPVELEPEVVVQAPRGMLLHDEQQRSAAAGRRLRRRLGRAREGALGRITLQRAAAHERAPIHAAAVFSSARHTSASVRPLCAGTWKA